LGWSWAASYRIYDHQPEPGIIMYLLPLPY
jgi:hypothetical protein